MVCVFKFLGFSRGLIYHKSCLWIFVLVLGVWWWCVVLFVLLFCGFSAAALTRCHLVFGLWELVFALLNLVFGSGETGLGRGVLRF